LLAELHDIDLRLTKRGTNWRRGGRLAGRDLELYLGLYFFRRSHCEILASFLNSRYFDSFALLHSSLIGDFVIG
jgi:hypothetical protein